jgi:hypothetical protein
MGVDLDGFDPEIDDPYDQYMDSLTQGQRKGVMRGDTLEEDESQGRRLRILLWPIGQVLKLAGSFYIAIGGLLKKMGERLL